MWCFEEFVLPAGKTLDFSATISSLVSLEAGNDEVNFQLRLYQGWRLVALNLHNKSVDDDSLSTNNSNLIFSEKNISEEDLPYKLCIGIKDEMKFISFWRNQVQWGYKILGDGYNLIEHRFDASSLKATPF